MTRAIKANSTSASQNTLHSTRKSQRLLEKNGQLAGVKVKRATTLVCTPQVRQGQPVHAYCPQTGSCDGQDAGVACGFAAGSDESATCAPGETRRQIVVTNTLFGVRVPKLQTPSVRDCMGFSDWPGSVVVDKVEGANEGYWPADNFLVYAGNVTGKLCVAQNTLNTTIKPSPTTNLPSGTTGLSFSQTVVAAVSASPLLSSAIAMISPTPTAAIAASAPLFTLTTGALMIGAFGAGIAVTAGSIAAYKLVRRCRTAKVVITPTPEDAQYIRRSYRLRDRNGPSLSSDDSEYSKVSRTTGLTRLDSMCSARSMPVPPPPTVELSPLNPIYETTDSMIDRLANRPPARLPAPLPDAQSQRASAYITMNARPASEAPLGSEYISIYQTPSSRPASQTN